MVSARSLANHFSGTPLSPGSSRKRQVPERSMLPWPTAGRTPKNRKNNKTVPATFFSNFIANSETTSFDVIMSCSLQGFMETISRKTGPDIFQNGYIRHFLLHAQFQPRTDFHAWQV